MSSLFSVAERSGIALFNSLFLAILSIHASATAASSPLSYVPHEERSRSRAARSGLPPGVDRSQLLAQVTGTVEQEFHHEFGNSRAPLLLAIVRSDETERLHVDLNGNLRFDADESFESKQGEWTFDVSPNPEQESARYDRADTQTLRARRERDRLLLTQGGYLEGEVALGEQEVSIRIVDANANGRFSDSEDRLLLDLNRDERFSPLREKFSSHGVAKINGRRYTIGYGTDESSISLQALEGTGYVIPKIPLIDANAEVVDFQCELVSTHGVHVSLNRLNSATEIPIGSYRVQRLRIDLASARQWRMGFERSSRTEGKPVDVDKGQTVEFDLLGSLSLDASVVFGSLTSRSAVMIQPRLNSSTGLYLSVGLVGDLDPQDDNRLSATLIDLKENSRRDVVAVEGTGFSCGGFCPIRFDDTNRLSPTSIVVLKFDSGPLAGELIRTMGSVPRPNASNNQSLELP